METWKETCIGRHCEDGRYCAAGSLYNILLEILTGCLDHHIPAYSNISKKVNCWSKRFLWRRPRNDGRCRTNACCSIRYITENGGVAALFKIWPVKIRLWTMITIFSKVGTNSLIPVLLCYPARLPGRRKITHFQAIPRNLLLTHSGLYTLVQWSEMGAPDERVHSKVEFWKIWSFKEKTLSMPSATRCLRIGLKPYPDFYNYIKALNVFIDSHSTGWTLQRVVYRSERLQE